VSHEEARAVRPLSQAGAGPGKGRGFGCWGLPAVLSGRRNEIIEGGNFFRTLLN
jgi:hypothetical protein